MAEDNNNLKFDTEKYAENVGNFLISVSDSLGDEELNKKANDFAENLSSSLKVTRDTKDESSLSKKIIDLERLTRTFFKKSKTSFNDFIFEKQHDGRYYILKNFEFKYNLKRKKRAAGYCLNIIWATLLLILINFYRDYIAYFQIIRSDEFFSIRKFSLVTADFSNILLLANTMLLVIIASNIILISYDKYKINRILHIVTNIFLIVFIVNTATIFPFSLNILPYGPVTAYLPVIVKIVMGLIVFILGIQVIINFIKIIKRTDTSHEIF